MQVQEMACNGRNWGLAEIESSTLVFKIAQKPAFRVPLRDVGQVQQVIICAYCVFNPEIAAELG